MKPLKIILILSVIGIIIWYFWNKRNGGQGAADGVSNPVGEVSGVGADDPEYSDVSAVTNDYEPSITISNVNTSGRKFDYSIKGGNYDWSGENVNFATLQNSTACSLRWPIKSVNAEKYLFVIMNLLRPDGTKHSYVYIFDTKYKSANWYLDDCYPERIKAANALKATAVNLATGDVTVVK